MKKDGPPIINSISEQHRILSLPKPQHPLVSVFNFEDIDYQHYDKRFSTLILNMYCIALKRNITGKVKYGQGYYDFDEGIMSFIAPNQVTSNIDENHIPSGWCVVVHPDFIRKHLLGRKIKDYGFFSYASNEALHLSEKEEAIIISVMKLMAQEISSSIDHFSEHVIIAHLELLLSYADRFYNRQFITRKNASSDVLIKFEDALNNFFEESKKQEPGLPTVQHLAEQLHVSASYLNDMLKSLTGQTTQQHIHNNLIERAKELLSTTTLSVSEIAYQMGFEYPQSFNKLFKNKTNVTPLKFRQSFN